MSMIVSDNLLRFLNEIRIGKGIGRPRSRLVEVLADAAYDDKDIRLSFRRRGIKSNISCNKRNRKAPKRSRPTGFYQQPYKK